MEQNDDGAAARAVREKDRMERAANAAAVQSIGICFGATLIATAGAAFAVARLNVRAFGESVGRPPTTLDIPLGVAGAIASLLVALWTICRRITTPRATLVITAVLFGLLHAPGWGWAGVPSRILQGVVFGILRLRTGGLAAPTIAHLSNNFVAVGFLSGM